MKLSSERIMTMNNCKEKIEELKKLGLDGLYKLILEQQEQIDRLFGALGRYLNGDTEYAEKILWGDDHNECIGEDEGE